MAWWDKIVSAAKVAVQKVVQAVSTVVNTVKTAVTSSINVVKEKIEPVVTSVKKEVVKQVEVAKAETKVVADVVKKAASVVVEEVKEKYKEAEKVVEEKIAEEKKWPKMPVDLPGKLKPYWLRMEDAYVRKDKEAMLKVLRELIPLTASPMPALAAIFGIAGVVGLIVTLVGSYPFAGFIREEALQTIDFGIRTAQYVKDIEGLEKAIAFKKELLERTIWEKIVGAIPVATVVKELQDFYKASQIKLEIDERNFERLKTEITGVGLPERVEATVRDIIDGDTIDVDINAKDVVTGEGFKLPEYGTTGHARIRIVGINAPEKSPKGEILCSDVEIYKVEGKWADESRNRLVPLNDKKVILKIDPAAVVDTHGRILAVIDFSGVDIGKRQITEGLACRYYREPNKYVDEELYKEETLKAKEEGKGMWENLKEVEKEEDKIKIYIDSKPTNAKLYIDDRYVGHRTPSDEKELSDVMHLLTLGPHILSAEKGGDSGMVDIEIVKGDNGRIIIELVPAPIREKPKEVVPPIEVPEVEVPIKEVPVVVEEPVKPEEIPTEYTTGQVWALTEAFGMVEELTKGPAQMSEAEYKQMVDGFTLYTSEQKQVLDLLFRDVWLLIRGREVMSEAEREDLKIKYRME